MIDQGKEYNKPYVWEILTTEKHCKQR